MPKSSSKALSKMTTKHNLWKKWVPTLVLFLVPILLGVQIGIYYAAPENFPVGVSYLTRTRYDPTLLHDRPELYSIIGFLPCPVESYIDCKINLKSLEEVGVKWTQVSHLTDNTTSLELVEITLFPIDYVHDPILTLNGQNAAFYLSNDTGLQCLTAKGFNLTDTSQIETVVTTFNVERAASNENRSVNIPWVFNENYAQIIKFPAIDIAVEKNKTSEESTFKIVFDLPFRQLVTGMSGWVDRFDLPYSHWIFLNPNSTSVPYKEVYFEYPINQTVQSSGNTYYFKTNFSEQNTADSYMITTIPSFDTILFLFPFMASPFIIFIEGNTLGKREKIRNLKGFLRFIYGFGLSYSFCIAFVFVLTGGLVQSLSLFFYLLGIMSPLGFLTLVYPPISYAVLHKTILKV
ncbi:MAG: hypothetical protein ABSG57_03840 [Candidatus Bathyarchaeia archaeon]